MEPQGQRMQGHAGAWRGEALGGRAAAAALAQLPPAPACLAALDPVVPVVQGGILAQPAQQLVKLVGLRVQGRGGGAGV